jgi:hypothetical protein
MKMGTGASHVTEMRRIRNVYGILIGKSLRAYFLDHVAKGDDGLDM